MKRYIVTTEMWRPEVNLHVFTTQTISLEDDDFEEWWFRHNLRGDSSLILVMELPS